MGVPNVTRREIYNKRQHSFEEISRIMNRYRALGNDVELANQQHTWIILFYGQVKTMPDLPLK
jgi:hypothetical protein